MLFGLAVGDALGVPAEFKSRKTIRKDPIKGMTGFGTHDQPPGTFSDDSSLAFCLAEALSEGFDLDKIAQNFLKWEDENYWTAHGEVFDIGISTSRAISRLRQGESPGESGCTEASSNGNGSLMSIAPLVFHLAGKQIDERFELTRQVSSITHSHVRSVIACFYYLEFALQLLQGKDKFEIYEALKSQITDYLNSIPVSPLEIDLFDRLLKGNIYELTEEEISGSTYVIDSLEAAVWCLLTTENYSEAVLKAVNLGQDTDTTAAVTGALAGLLYGFENIPSHWVKQLARHEDIDKLAVRLGKKYA
jgi:ADP-ribosylglycohydrolase